MVNTGNVFSMKHYLILGLALISVMPSRAQNDTNLRQEAGVFDHTLRLRALAYGGGEAYDMAASFVDAELKLDYRQGKALAGMNLRLSEGLIFGEKANGLELREAFVGYSGAVLDVRLGRQIVKWGRTDGFNPCNNVCSQDYFYLSPDPEDQQIGNFMARLRWRMIKGAELELLLMPFFQPSVYRYELFDMGGQARFALPMPLEPTIGNGTLAARFNMEGKHVGFSLSYFNGYDPFYGFRVKDIQLFPTVMITYVPAYYHKQSVGADMALPLGSWIARAEAAWDLTGHYGDTMQVPNPSISYVVAIEREVAGITCILEYVGKHTFDFEPLVQPVLLDSNDLLAQLQYGLAMIAHESSRFNRLIHHQQDAWNHALFLALRRSFAYETLEAELGTYYNFGSEEYFFRPMIRWHVNDALSCHLGGYYMAGPDDEVYDRAGQVLNGITVGMQLSF
jgi:hypothetical protein